MAPFGASRAGLMSVTRDDIPDSGGTHQYNATAGTGTTLEDVIGSLDGDIQGASWQSGIGAGDNYLLYDGDTDQTELPGSDSDLSHFSIGQGTIFAWIRPDSRDRSPICGVSSSTSDAGGPYLDWEQDEEFRVEWIIDNERYKIEASPGAPTETWFPVILTGDGSGGEAEGYWGDPTNNYELESLGTVSLPSATEGNLDDTMLLGRIRAGEVTFDGGQDIVWFDDKKRSQSDLQSFVDDSKHLYE